MAGTSSPNFLGLDFDQLKIQEPLMPLESTDPPKTPLDTSESAQQPFQDDQPANTTHAETRDKKKPYVNHERVKTGGSQRDKLSEEALTERMARMREQNERIKQRRMDVKADEDAFRKTQDLERARLAQNRKVQENVDRTREQNAKRKMDKIQAREWDSNKPAGDWKHQTKKSQIVPPASPAGTNENSSTNISESKQLPQESGGWTRGGGPRGGSRRGRGRGRGLSNTGQEQQPEKPDETATVVSPLNPTNDTSANAKDDAQKDDTNDAVV